VTPGTQISGESGVPDEFVIPEFREPGFIVSARSSVRLQVPGVPVDSGKPCDSGNPEFRLTPEIRICG
jgi:hypothetical protein